MKKLIIKIIEKMGIRVQFMSKIRQYEANQLLWIGRLDVNYIFDVGANEGQFAKKILSLFPKANYICFEPIGERLAKACVIIQTDDKTLERRGYQVVLGNRDGVVKFNVHDIHFSSSVLEMHSIHHDLYPGSAPKTEIEVPIRKLDSMFTTTPMKHRVFLKLDVQGYELAVLNGAVNFLNSVQVIMVEVNFEQLYKGQPTFDEINIFLTRHGFEFCGSYDEQRNKVDGKPISSDLFFVRKGISDAR